MNVDMTTPTMTAPRLCAPETFVLPAYFPIPGGGLLPMNSFLIRGRSPVLVDAGPLPLKEAFLESIQKIVDVRDLAYIWLTHMDPDHTGAAMELLRAAPGAKLVTTFLGLGKLSMRDAVPMDRVVLLSPGESLDVGDRRLAAVRPPVYDAPETIGIFDAATRVLFAADAFGALLDTPAETAGDIGLGRIRDGMAAWAGIDNPWLADVDRSRFGAALERFGKLQIRTILSSHLPPADGLTPELLQILAAVPDTFPEPALAR